MPSAATPVECDPSTSRALTYLYYLYVVHRPTGYLLYLSSHISHRKYITYDDEINVFDLKLSILLVTPIWTAKKITLEIYLPELSANKATLFTSH